MNKRRTVEPDKWQSRAREMARGGLNSTAIARALGVSRQRVYQVLQRDEVLTPRMRTWRLRAAEPLLKIRHVRVPQGLLDAVELVRRQLSKERGKTLSWSEALRELVEEALRHRRRG